MKINKQKMWHTRQIIYDVSGLDKIISIAFLEVKLLVEDPIKSDKLGTFQKLKIT